jgi:glycosyltransferase involved in cell wall biosynthesis
MNQNKHTCVRMGLIASHPIQYHAPLFRELARRIDVTVFFSHRQTAAGQGVAGFGVGFDWDIDLLSGYEHQFLDNVASQPGLECFTGVDTPAIAERLREGRFNALLVMGWHLKSYVQGTVAAKRLGIPVLVRGDSQLATPRSAIKRLGKRLLYPCLLRQFDAALYVGKRSRAYYAHYHYPAGRLFFSPHCVDNAFFANRATPAARRELRNRLGIADGDRVLLFAGKLQPFKRPLDLVDAASELRRRGKPVQVLVAGAGELEGDLSRRAADRGVPLHLLGFQNQSQMPAAYAAADVLVLPSDGRETWGLVANEALACGRPVLVSEACGCASDLAADGRAGAVFPVGDVRALADGLARLFDRPPTAEAILAKAQDYSLERAADGLSEALAFLAARSRSAA